MRRAIASLWCFSIGSSTGFLLPLESHTASARLSLFRDDTNAGPIREDYSESRRQSLKQIAFCLPSLVGFSQISYASSFTPGGTLVDREIGVTVGNSEASPNRKVDNSNVLFNQDHYFKFGVAAPWIVPDSVDFPKSLPFVLSQQRYDTLKKYGQRVNDGVQVMNNLVESIKDDKRSLIADATDPIYALRPLGLLANGFLGSENTGTTNELLLARWYINEMYLRVGDIRNAGSEKDALYAYEGLQKAINSYYAMMNRVITSKVGNKFEYVH